MVECNGFSKAAINFLVDLRANNNREWFQENKKDYEKLVRDPSRVFAAAMAERLEILTGSAQKAKIFRINRDIRFSKDKTPYNTHIHLSFTPAESGTLPFAWMFGVSPDYCTVGIGAFEFKGAALEAFRAKLAAAGSQLVAELEGLEGQGVRLSEPSLKRVPAPYPSDHVAGRWLKHKGLAAWVDFAGPEIACSDSLVDDCSEAYKSLLPLKEALVG